jgi:adenylate cyclase
MQEHVTRRKLTAILYADVAGYSRLTRQDEVGTHRRVMEILDFASDTIRKRNGTVLRYAGDAILAEFSSVVSAVETAVVVQSELAQQNQNVEDDSKTQIRIGVNLGEVLADRNEIYGDGVNLAARLEAAAHPGGVCISSVVYDPIRGKIGADFEDGGEQMFKNIDRPVYIFHWKSGLGNGIKTSGRSIGTKPSIAVLPFTNMSGDAEQEYFADGISEDIITALSKVKAFLVIARNSTFTYKGRAVNIKQIASDLGVRYVLEGSVRKAGNRVRITAQLIEAETGHHVWAEKYDRELIDIFDLQDEMTQTIAGAMEPELNAAERERAANKPPETLNAWEIYQRGLQNMWEWKRDTLKAAIDCFQRAIAIDPGFARAHAYLSYSRYMTVILGWAENSKDELAEGLGDARRAIMSDDKDAAPYFAAGRIYMMQGKHDESIAAINTALELNPNFAHANHALGFVLSLAGDLEPAKDAARKAIELSPRDPALWAFTVCHALTFVLTGENEDALHWANKTVQIGKPTGYWGPAMLAAAHANLGNMDEARTAVEEALKEKPDLTLTYLKETLPTKHDEGLEPYLSGLRKAGLPE